MKIPYWIPSAFATAAALALPAVARADSRTPAHSVSTAVGHSGAASVHAVAASGELGRAALNVVAGTAALAFWTGGSTAAAAGSAVAQVGGSVAHTGHAVAHGGQALWDFASSDPARRPMVNRARSLPPGAVPPRCDPPPSVVMPVNRP